MTSPLGTNVTTSTPHSDGNAPQRTRRPVRPARRVSTETKSSWKTTEFWIYVLVVVGIFIASQTVGSDSGAANGGNATDYFRADKAWLYIVLVTIGYLFSRGLAKSGSRDFYDVDSDTDDI